MARKAKKGKSKGFTIPSLANVTTRKAIPKGWYKARVSAVEHGEGEKGDYFRWTFEIIEGKSKGQTPKQYFTSLAPASLWNLKGLLEAVGFKIPKKGDIENFDPESLIDEELYIYVDREIYEGRPQAIITQVADEPQDADEDEDDDGEEDEDEDAETAEADDDDEEEEDEDEDGDVTEESIGEMTQDELEDFCSENDLDLDAKALKKLKTLPKMRKAVVKLAKKAGLV